MDSTEFLFELEVFPVQCLAGIDLTEDNQKVLSTIGLPRWVAPHLYFGAFDKDIYLPKLIDWPWIEDWVNANAIINTEYENFYVLGSSQDNAPIFLKPNDSSVYTFVEDGREEIFMNKSLQTLLTILNEYAKLIESAVDKITPSLLEAMVAPKESLHSFKQALKFIEGEKALSKGFWYSEIEKWSTV